MEYITISKSGKQTKHKLILEDSVSFDFFGYGVDIRKSKGRPTRYHIIDQFYRFGFKNSSTRFIDSENLSLVYAFAKEKGKIKC